MGWKADQEALQAVKPGDYAAECTEARYYPAREGKPEAFQLTWGLTAGAAGTEDPPELSTVTEFINFWPPSDAKKHKGVVIQLKRFARATGRKLPEELTDENVAEWQEAFVGAALTMKVSYDESGEYTRLRY